MQESDKSDTILPPAPDAIQPHKLTFDGPRGPLFKAMAEARKHFLPLAKDGKADVSNKEGRHLYTFTYSPLDAVLAALEPGLNAAGIALMQPFDGDALYTIVACGESSLTVETPLPRWSTPQELGSLLTYLRRYQVKGIFGVADAEDDDGNAASGNKAEVKRAEPRPRNEPKAAVNEGPKGLTESVIKAVYAAAKSKELPKADFHAMAKDTAGKEWSEYTPVDAEKLLARIQGAA